LLLLLNADHREVGFVLPSVPGPQQWTRLIDTADCETHEQLPVAAVGDRYPLMGRSLALFALVPPGRIGGAFGLIQDGLLTGTRPDTAWHRS
jgi:glycogen operon protein